MSRKPDPGYIGLDHVEKVHVYSRFRPIKFFYEV
jgi:hypothetical protein